jgi:hypothetical protein
MGKIFSTITLLIGLIVLGVGTFLLFYGMPDGDLCSATILASDYSHINEAEREGACLDDNFKALAVISVMALVGSLVGGIISILGLIWVWFAWRKTAS